MGPSLKQSTKHVKGAALGWVMSSDGHYHNFLEMLITETEDRWLLPHYLVVRFSDSDSQIQAAWELAYVLSFSLESRMGEYDKYAEYVKEARALLSNLYPANNLIEEVFGVYDKIRVLPKQSDLSSIIGENPPEYLEVFL